MDVLVDTNVILRRIHRGHPQHGVARVAIGQYSSGGHRLCVTSQNLIESWAICTRPRENNGLGMSPDQTDRILRRVEMSAFRIPDSDAVYFEWRRLVTLHGVAGKKAHDARLVAAMNVSSVTHILTFNASDFTRFRHLTVIDPAAL